MLRALALAVTATASSYTGAPHHFWVDPLDVVLPAAIAEQATIAAPPSAPPAATVSTSAWLMVDDGTDWTQIGVMWDPGYLSSAVVFAESDQAVTFGPELAPGQGVTVRLARAGAYWVDEYNAGAGWQVLQRSVAPGTLDAPTVEAYGPTSVWCFRSVGLELGQAWHHLASVCLGKGTPDQ